MSNIFELIARGDSIDEISRKINKTNKETKELIEELKLKYKADSLIKLAIKIIKLNLI